MFLAIFHDTIKDAVPMIVNLLNDSDSNVRLAAAYAIGNLAEQCIVVVVTTRFTQLRSVSSHIR
jgi:HEAT repeat protein